MELKEKAYSVNNSNFDEPYFAPEKCYYAENVGKAKKKCLDDIKYDGYTDTKGKDISFINLKMQRAKCADKYLVDGKIKTLVDIEYDKRLKERNDAIDLLVSENPTAKAYVKKGGYYYRPNSSGYTERTHEAGIYSIQEAAAEVKGISERDCASVILIDNDVHNKMINEKIEDLKTRLIL